MAGKSAGKGYGAMDPSANGKGMYSSKKNPVPQPSRDSQRVGPGSNPDQMKANKLLDKCYKQKESLRGVGVM